MKCKHWIHSTILAAAVLFPHLNATAASPAPINLQTAATFGVLAGSKIENTGATAVGGHIGSFPTATITGFPLGTFTGVNHGGDAVTQLAKTHLGTAYADAAGRVPDVTYAPIKDLGGLILPPGVYNDPTSFAITGTLTLDAAGDVNAVWIFQAGTTLITAGGSSVVLTNGAQAANVFWQVGSSATLGTGSNLKGTILALTSITLTTGATLSGKALAQNGAVTLDGNSVAGATPTTLVLAQVAIAACYQTVAAAEAAAILATTATFNCPGVVTKTAVTVGTCSAVITVTVTDGCGNSANVTFNTRIDNVAPVPVAGVIAVCYQTVAAAEAAAVLATTVTDNCPGVVTKTAATVGTCSAVITVTVTDGCGNAASVTYNTRIDNVAPVSVVGVIAACYQTVAAAEAAAILATTATDNCPGVVTTTASTVGTCSAVITVTVTDGCGNAANVTYTTRIDNIAPVPVVGVIAVCYQTVAAAEAAAVLATTVTDNCPGVVTKTAVTVGTCSAVITVTVADGCGNTANVTFNTRIDNVAPVPVAGVIAACFQTVAAAEAAAILATTATDNCPGVVTKTAITVGTCGAVITVTVADGCGNSANVTYNTRIDNVAPVPVAGVIAACFQTVAAAEAAAILATTATDNCPGVVTKTAITLGTCSAVITVTVTDGCGNSANVTFNTRIDNAAPVPVVGLIAACYQTVAAAEAAAILATTVTDNCPGVVTKTAVTVGTCSAVITVTVTDGCGNSANVTFNTRIDNVAPVPVVGVIAACYQTVAAAEAAAILATTATDNCPGVVTKTAITLGTCSAVITVTVTDGCGNSANVTYNTRIDNVAPVSAAGVIAACYQTVAAAEAAAILATTATDNCPGVVTKTAVTVGTCSAVITVTVTDGCGNAASVTYTTRIDNVAPVPVVGVISGCYQTVAAAEAAAILATTATDNCPGVVTTTASTVGTCSAVITVTVTDGCGNSANVTYNTRIDNVAPVPVVGLIAACYQTVAAAEAAAILATTVTDNCPGVVTKTAVTVGTCSAVITVTVTDSCGNAASVTYTTRIDNIAPVPVAGVIAACYQTAAAAEAAAILVTTATDNCPGVVAKTASTVGTCSAVITVTVTDGCGNAASVTYTTRIDNAAPVLTGQGGPLTINCPATPTFTAPTATDNCDLSPVITFTDSTPAPGAVAYSITRTWTARDVCGNMSSPVSQTITVLDITPRLIITQNCPTTPVNLGGQINFSVSVINAGDITLNSIVVTNDHSGITPLVGPVTLAPGATGSYTGSYTAPADCATTSISTVRAVSLCGVGITDTASATCTLTTSPRIAVTLVCPVVPAATGGVITYTGTVSNPGNVTLSNVVVISSQLNTVLIVPSLAPGAFTNFSATFTAPLDACSFTSSVTANGSDACTAVRVTSNASTICALVTTPSLIVTRTCPPTAVAPGGVLVYGGSVRNTGNVTLTNIMVVSSQPVPNTTVFILASLAPGASASFNSSFNAPLDACSVTSTLIVSAQSFCTGTTVMGTETNTCPLVTFPQITITKACPLQPVIPGGLLVYTGTVTNTGNVTLTNVFVVNNQPALNTPVFGPITLAPGAGATFTSSYTAPANLCAITDTLTARAQDKCSGTTVSISTTTSCPILTSSRLTVTQLCPLNPVESGNLLTYSASVRNTGDTTLTNIVVTHDRSGTTPVFTLATLAPGTSANFTGSYTVPLNSGCTMTTTLTVRANDATSLCGGTLVVASATAACVLLTAPALELTQVCPSIPVAPGSILTYSGTVRNAGNITLTNVVVINNRTGATPIFTLANLPPGEMASFTGSYLVPVNSGCSITSTLTASGNDPCRNTTVSISNTTPCALEGAPRIAVTLVCPPGPVPAGGLIQYTGIVNNPGNVTLSNVVVTSSQFNTVLIVAALAPGASTNFGVSFTASADACAINNSVSASASNACTAAPVTSSASALCALVSTPSLTVTRLCPPTEVVPGGVLVYGGSVRNTGNVTLTNITVVSSQPVPNTTVFVLASLAPGASASFNSSFNAPLDACSVTSTLTVTGQSLCAGAAVTGTETSTCPIVTLPQIAVTKACPLQPVTPGGILVYTGTVTNTGNVTLTNVFVINNQPALNTRVFGPITLAPGAGAAFTASYTIPANLCAITDTLTATGQDKCRGTTVSISTTTSCSILSSSRLAVTQLCPPNLVGSGSLFTYTGSVRNTGDTTLTNIVVTNDRTGATPVFTLATLAPGISANFTGSYSVPANSGCSITSTLTARGNDSTSACGGTPVVATATTLCPLLTAPALEMTQACPSNPVVPGAILTYSGMVRNAGNVTLTNVVVVNSRTGATPIFTLASLPPGETASFTGSYLVPVNSGCSITSTLTARANDSCRGTTVSISTTTPCALAGTPRIAVTLVCPVGPVSPGGLIRYTGIVSNPGNITLSNVVVASSQLNTVLIVPSLAPGAFANFTASFTAPADACSISSTVTATGGDACTAAPVTSSASALCALVTTPSLTVTRVCPPTAVAPGGVLVYGGSVRNTGNITLTNITVVSSQPVANTPVFHLALLAPGASASFDSSFNTPLDACSVTSTLIVTGRSLCTGSTVTGQETSTCSLAITPQLTVTKICPPASITPGAMLTYSGTVTNTGNVTLTNVFVVNSQPAPNTLVFGPVTLAPGAGAGFTGSYLVPANVCSITGTVTATGQDKCANTTVASSFTTTCLVFTSSRLAVTQACPIFPVGPGGLLTYSGSVRNTGDTTLTNIVVTSDRTGATPVFSLTTLAPGGSATFTGSYTVPANSGCSTTATLTARGNDSSSLCGGTPVIASATILCPLLTASALEVALVCPSTPTMPGALLTYSGTVRNAGNVTLTNVVVVNSRSGATPIFTLGSLPPGAVASFSGSYIVTAGSNPATDTITARGIDICQARSVTATANCSGPVSPSGSPDISSITVANGMVKVSWAATSGVTYSLQYRSNSLDSVWKDIAGYVTASGGTASKEDFLGSDSQRLYRVRIVSDSPVLGSITTTNAVVTISWAATAGVTYSLQYKSNSLDSVWKDLAGYVTASGDTASKEDFLGFDPLRLYRVRIVSDSPVIGSITTTNAVVTVSWAATPGITYSLQNRSNALDSVWKDIPGYVTASSATASKVDLQGFDRQRLYRVRIVSDSPVIASITTANGMATVSWTATPGVTYSLQSKSNALDSVWKDMAGYVTASGETASKVDPIGANNQRLYRVRIVPE